MGSIQYYSKVDLSPVARPFTIVLLAMLLMGAQLAREDQGAPLPFPLSDDPEARAVQKLTRQQHILYRASNTMFGRHTHQLMDGRKMRISGSGQNMIAEWV